MEVDKDYFKSYFDLNVHEVMLKDEVRTMIYEAAIRENAADFEDKVVLDGVFCFLTFHLFIIFPSSSG
jgi:hypothetical protein